MFDARAAKALEAGNHLTFEGTLGLRLVATEQYRTWTYRYKSPINGRMRQLRLGRWPAMTFPAALAAWERSKAERDAGRDPAEEKRQRRRESATQAREAGYTVGKARDEFLEAYAGTVAPKTYAEAQRLLQRELGPIEGRVASTVTRADAFDLLDAMRDRPVIATTLRGLLGAVWDRALDAGRLAPDVPNWWRLVLRGKLKSKGKRIKGQAVGTAKRVLREPELGVLLLWLPNFSRLVADVLALYLWTGARGAELVQIEAEEVAEEVDGLWWTCPKAKTKNARHEEATDLRIPLVGDAERIVRRRIALYPAGYLFPSTGKSGHVEQKTIQTAVHYHQPYSETRPRQERPRLPVTHWAPHDLRRSARTLLAAMGCPRDIGEVVLGHMLPGVEGTYNLHAYDRERREWLTQLARRLERLSSGLVPAGDRSPGAIPRTPAAPAKASRSGRR